MISKLYPIGCVKGCDKSPAQSYNSSYYNFKVVEFNSNEKQTTGESSIRQWTSRPFLWEKTHQFKVSDSSREFKRMHVHLRDPKIPRNERKRVHPLPVFPIGDVWSDGSWWIGIACDGHPLGSWRASKYIQINRFHIGRLVHDKYIETTPVMIHCRSNDHESSMHPHSGWRIFFLAGFNVKRDRGFWEKLRRGFWPQLSFSRRDGKRLLERRIR